MSGPELRAWREARGWSQAQCARALHYTPEAWGGWERGRTAIPPAVVAWVQAWPPVPRARRYTPDAAGLRRLVRRTGLVARELAAFTGACEESAWRWMAGVVRLPLPIRAWLSGGAPPAWRWSPDGSPSSWWYRQRPPREPRTRRRPGSRTLRRFARGTEAA